MVFSAFRRTDEKYSICEDKYVLTKLIWGGGKILFVIARSFYKKYFT